MVRWMSAWMDKVKLRVELKSVNDKTGVLNH